MINQNKNSWTRKQLHWWAKECDRTNFGCQASTTLQAAAELIDEQQLEIEHRFAQFLEYSDKVEALTLEIERLRSASTAFMTSPIGDLPVNSDGLRKAIDEMAKLRVERDAVVSELKQERGCYSCKMVGECAVAFYHDDCPDWQWRGAGKT